MENNSAIVELRRHIDKMEKEIRRLGTMKFRQFNALFGLAGSGHVIIGVGGIQIMQGTTVMGEWQTDGDIFIGSNIALPASTYFSILAAAQTYNGEAFSAGDMLIGDNSAAKANIFWDKSAGRLNFRGGTTTQVYIDTDGSLTAGGGNVLLNTSGISLIANAASIPDPANSNTVAWKYGAFIPLYLGASYDATADYVMGNLIVSGNANERAGILQIVAKNNAGSMISQIQLTGFVSSSEIALTASLVKVNGVLNLPPVAVTISGGTFARTGSWMVVTGESSPDNLDTITGGVAGDIIILSPVNNTDDVVIKYSTAANGFRTNGSADFTLTLVQDKIVFIFNGTYWNEIGRGDNG